MICSCGRRLKFLQSRSRAHIPSAVGSPVFRDLATVPFALEIVDIVDPISVSAVRVCLDTHGAGFTGIQYGDCQGDTVPDCSDPYTRIRLSSCRRRKRCPA